MNGTQYAVNICKQTARTGNIVQLTGASQPFSTQEDDSDDIFTPIRTQTGYLRVIDTDGTLLADLIPANNTECLVQLWSGTNSGGTFTPHALRWQGFLQAQAYTQPWDNNASMLELPVKSLLGALEDVSISETFASTEKNVAALILAAFDNFGLEADNDLTHLVITADVSDAPNTLLKPFIQMSVFFDKETFNNQGDSYEQLVGMSYYEALSAVMSLYGLQLRENASNIYMSQFDGTNLKTWSVGWGIQLRGLANGSTVVIDSYDLPSVDMLTALTFKGADNIAGYSQGGRSAKVTLNFDKIDESICELPRTTEDASEVSTVPSVYNGVVKVQPHAPRTNATEEFTYLYYDRGNDPSPVARTYDRCIANSVIQRSIFSTDPSRVLGAFPVRWSFRASNDSRSQMLINGLMLNTFDAVGYGSALPDNARAAYAISSSAGYTHYNGFLHLDIGIISFLNYQYVAQLIYWFFGNFDVNYGENRCCFYLKLKWGNKYWDGTQWTTTESTFMIETDSENIISNVDQYKGQTDLSGGYVIPITEVMSGTVQLTIMNFAAAKCIESDSVNPCPFISSIINKLSVDYISLSYQTESQRSNNTYRQNILTSGFSEEKSVDLTVGTYNNNYDSASFIKQNLTTYIEKFPYIDASSTINQRPELHLLDRMADHYGQVRRMFIGIVQRGVELMQTVYGYSGRLYFGVRAETDWRDDTEEVKFIEV